MVVRKGRLFEKPSQLSWERKSLIVSWILWLGTPLMNGARRTLMWSKICSLDTCPSVTRASRSNAPSAVSKETGDVDRGRPLWRKGRGSWKNMLGLSIQDSASSRWICPLKWASTRGRGRLLSRTYSSVTAAPADCCTQAESRCFRPASFRRIVTSFTGSPSRVSLWRYSSSFLSTRKSLFSF